MMESTMSVESTRHKSNDHVRKEPLGKSTGMDQSQLLLSSKKMGELNMNLRDQGGEDSNPISCIAARNGSPLGVTRSLRPKKKEKLGSLLGLHDEPAKPSYFSTLIPPKAYSKS